MWHLTPITLKSSANLTNVERPLHNNQYSHALNTKRALRQREPGAVLPAADVIHTWPGFSMTRLCWNWNSSQPSVEGLLPGEDKAGSSQLCSSLGRSCRPLSHTHNKPCLPGRLWEVRSWRRRGVEAHAGLSETRWTQTGGFNELLRQIMYVHFLHLYYSTYDRLNHLNA